MALLLVGGGCVCVRSIRHYDEHGLLTSIRASNGYRAFPLAAVTQVRQIQRMIEGASACSETSETQRKRLASIERQIADLERRRARLLKTLTEGAIPALDQESPEQKVRANATNGSRHAAKKPPIRSK